ncbi:MAG: tetratricopeptide repeat protein [Vicinamibacteria bacterium]
MARSRPKRRAAATPDAPPPTRAPAAPALAAAAVFGIALALRLLLLFQLHGHPLLQPTGVLDDAEYFRLAQRAAGGDWALGPGAYYVSPLYIYFLAAVFRIAGVAVLHAQLVQVVLGAAAAALVAVTGRRLFGARAGVLAGLLAAATGVFVFDEILVLQSALDPFLAALALERLSAALLGPTAARFAAAGAVFGLLGLNRPNALAACAVVVLVALVTERTRRGALHAAALAAGVALALAPAAIRNRAVTGEWVLVSSHGGLNFLIGNHPGATGGYGAPPGVTPTIAGQSADTTRVAEAAAGRSLTDAEVSDHFYREGWRFVRAQPGRAAALFARKLALTLGAAELPLNYAYAYWSRDEPTVLRGLVVGAWLLVPLGLAGLAVPPRVPRRALAVWASFLPAYALAVALFFVAWRYRLPLLVGLAVTAGAAIDWAWRAAATRNAAGWRPLAALCAAGALIAWWPYRVDNGLADERTERLVHLIVEGRGAEARALLAQTLPIHRDPGLVHYRAGRAWLDAGRADEAAAELQESLRAAPDQAEVHLALGQALLRQRRPQDALPHLARARAASVSGDVAGLETARALLALDRRDEARGVVAATPLLADSDAVTATALGVLAVTLGDPDAALRFLERAIALAPGSGDAHEHRGLALEQRGRHAEAIASLEAACRLAPADPTAHFNLALLYARAGRLAEARAVARRAAALDPASPHVRKLIDDLGPESGPAGLRRSG